MKTFSVMRNAVAMVLVSTGGFVANGATLLPPIRAETEPPLCPSGWVEAHDEGCFTFLDEEPNLSWIDANLACEKVLSAIHNLS